MDIVESINETPNLTSPQGILRTALELMNNGGRHWIKGRYSKRDPKTWDYSYCSMGSIHAALSKAKTKQNYFALIKNKERAIRALNYSLNGSLNYSTTAIMRFNDKPNTTWENVVEVFERAIRALDEGKIP